MKLSDKIQLKVNCFSCGKLRYPFFINYLHLDIDENDRIRNSFFRIPFFCNCSNDRINIFNERGISIGYWSKKKKHIKFDTDKTFYALNVFFNDYFDYLRKEFNIKKHSFFTFAGEYFLLHESKSRLSILIASLHQQHKFWVPKSVSYYNPETKVLKVQKHFLEKLNYQNLTNSDNSVLLKLNEKIPSDFTDYCFFVVKSTTVNKIKSNYIYFIKKNQYAWVFPAYLFHNLDQESGMQDQFTDNGKKIFAITIRGNYLYNVNFIENKYIFKDNNNQDKVYDVDTIPELFFDPKPVKLVNQLRYTLIYRINHLKRIREIKIEQSKAKQLENSPFNLTSIKQKLGLGNIQSSDQCLCCKKKIDIYENLVCDACYTFLEEDKDLTSEKFDEIKIDYEYLPQIIFKDKYEILFTDEGIIYRNKIIRWYGSNSNKKVKKIKVRDLIKNQTSVVTSSELEEQRQKSARIIEG